MIPNSYPGDEIFQKNLKSLDVSMSVWEIKMYLLGLLSSPEMVPPSFALEEILLTDTEDEVCFEDEKDYKEFIDLFMGLWNQLVSYDGSKTRYPKLSPIENSLKSKKDKIDYILKKGEELSSFYMGLDESGASELFDQCFELVKSQIGLSMMNDLFVDFSMGEYNNKINDQDIDEMMEVVEDFHENWPETYKNLNRIFLGIRRGAIDLDSEEEMER